MALEFPNILEATGIFDGRNPPVAGPTPIISASGIAEYDPASTPANPVGGFTRGVLPSILAVPQPAGYYIIGLERPIDGGEASISITNVLGGGALPAPVPMAIMARDGLIQVADGSHLPAVEGVPVDFSFYLHVFRIKYEANVTP